jgi:serine protease Do
MCRRILAWALVASISLISWPAVPAEETKQSPPKADAAAAVERSKDALVVIHPKEPAAETGIRTGPGLGIIIDPAGTVVTNHGSIAGPKQCEVVLSDGRRLDAKVLLSNPELDFAVLKIAAAKPFPFVEVADSKSVKEGDWVVALSATHVAAGDDLSVVIGLISDKAGVKLDGGFVFQVETSAGPGCSPGPLMTRDGKFVGLVISRALSPRVTSAVPASRIKQQVDEARGK